MTNGAIRIWLVLLLSVVGCLVAVPRAALGDIYHYVDRDGTHVFTTYRMSGMELVEVIRSQPSRSNRSSGRSSSSSSRIQVREDAFDPLIREAAETFNIPFEFIKAVVKAESAFNPRAVSRAGAQGLMQLMPRTGEEMGVTDPFDPRQNIFGGTRYLRILADRYNGDINLVLSAYNAGPGSVDRYDGIPYPDTRRYIQTVYRYYREYLAESD
ncbi:MAG: lytic transglycosylase domain-containing protein [Bradymonadales bacterium]|nr:lytic transglycosylase domain-containing protein [Bradymonadales bacterium]